MMNSVLPASRVEDAVCFCTATKANLNLDDEHVNVPSPVRGGIFNDGRTAWMARGNALEVVSMSDGGRRCAYRFGTNNEEETPLVTCVTELALGPLCRQLLVGLSYHHKTNRGMVCLFDERASKVAVAVALPAPVTSLERFNAGGNSPLRHMHGAVAAGTRGGRVFVVDLALDSGGRFSDETDPDEALRVKGRDLVEMRAEALKREKRRLAVSLDDDEDGGYFRCGSLDGEVAFPAGDVYVSALKFLPRLGYLAVGYNVGSFRLWNAVDFCFEFCSSYDGAPPVVSFAFQEPENDPKPFCYLWAAHGHAIRGRDHHQGPADSVSKARLYSLAFRRRKVDEGGGSRYEGPTVCTLRFEYGLGRDRGLVACSALEGPFVSRGSEEAACCDEGACGLCAFTWVPAAAPDGPGAVAAVFDLNQWYLAQMPSHYRYDEADLCPYLGFFRLDEVLDEGGGTRGGRRRIPLDAYVPSRKICGFSADDASMERQFYPSALSFDVMCLTTSGVVSASYLGLQRHALARLGSAGPLPLLDPREAHAACRFAGLVPQERRGPTDAAAQREAVFSLAIEHNLAHLVTDCVSTWATGEYAHLGCSPRTIQEWAWKKAGQIKSCLDRFCCGLFDPYGGGVAPDEAAVRGARRLVAHLSRLAAVFRALLSPAVPTTEHGARECESKLNAINLLAMYARVTLWFVDCGLLPETREEDEDEGVAYPAAALAKVYGDRRRELKRADSAIGGTELLMIDGLVARLGDSAASGLWEKEGGDGLFPPPSLHALLNVYLLSDEVPVSEKHRIVHYLLLDLAELFPTERHEELVMRFVRFPSSFALSPSIIKITQGFWLLDHKDFEEAIPVLLDPLVNSSDIAHWQHVRVLKALLYQNEYRKALKYARLRMPAFETAEDVRLMLTILLANGQVSQAFFYQRDNRDDANFEDLMFHFFSGCQQTKNLDALLQFPLSVTEEDALVRFLKNDGWPRSREVLVMYFLQRGRYAEAFGLNETLNEAYRGELDPAAGERASVRNMVTSGYASLLPRVQSVEANRSHHAVKRQRPFLSSSALVPAAGSYGHQQPVTTQSSAIADVAERIREMWNRVPAETTPLRRRRRPVDSHDDDLLSPGPFARPPATPASKLCNDRSTVIRFPSVTERQPEGGPNSRTETSDVTTASPNKKSRYSNDPSPVKAWDGAPKRSGAKFYYATEAQTLLQTPPVRSRRGLGGPLATPTVDATTTTTPQSILKARRVLGHREIPPTTTVRQEETAAGLAEDSRQLRFRASRPPSAEPQPEAAWRETLLRAVPRRPLRFDGPQEEESPAVTSHYAEEVVVERCEVTETDEEPAASSTVASDIVDPQTMFVEEEVSSDASESCDRSTEEPSSAISEPPVAEEEEAVSKDTSFEVEVELLQEEDDEVDVEIQVEEQEQEVKLSPRITRSSSSMSASPTSSAASVSPVTRSRAKLLDLGAPGRLGSASKEPRTALRSGSSAVKKKAADAIISPTTALELEEEKDVDTPLPTRLMNRSRLKSAAPTTTPSTTRRSSLRQQQQQQQQVAPSNNTTTTTTPKETPAARSRSVIGPHHHQALFSFSNPTVLLSQVEAEELPSTTTVPDKSFIFSPPMTRSRARRSRRESDNESACSDTDGGSSVTSTYSLRSNNRRLTQQQQGSDTPINFMTCSSSLTSAATTTTTASVAPRRTGKAAEPRGAARRFVKFR